MFLSSLTKINNRCFYVLLFLLASLQVSGQNFSRKDSLHGGLRKERTCFDVLHYKLDIAVDIDKKYLKGSNSITYKIIQETHKIQLDLFENMVLDSIVYQSKKLNFTREFGAVFIHFADTIQPSDNKHELIVYYQGNPQIARNAPWDGGFVFSNDSNNKPWIGVAVQGTGASLWYPVKDTQSDEPDNGAVIKITIPKELIAVSNGRLTGTKEISNELTQWIWEVQNPINTYNITLNIADYVYWNDTHKGIDLDYYVLRENLEKSKVHFEEVKTMLDCFQSKFGAFPFIDDGYKLVETPYLGMEHQSCVAYGNKYKKGYRGFDLSGTGVGLQFDFIIIHESGHEWFGNSITSSDIADMWIHEGFTQYAEIVYVECTQGYEKAMIYANGLRNNVRNDKPILGKIGVNHKGSGDMYPKGALLLNTLRHVINNDTKWWNIFYDFATTYRHKIITTEDVIQFFNEKSGMNLTSIFNHYLTETRVPKLAFKIENKYVYSRWENTKEDFSMPVQIEVNSKKIKFSPTTQWKKTSLKAKDVSKINIPDRKYYILQ